MGQKGDKHTNEAQLTCDLLLEKISSIGGITSKKMFGGHGIFHEGKMFAMVNSKGVAFLKTDLEEPAEGSVKHSKMPYHSIPEDTFHSPKLMELANHAIAISKA